MKTLGLPFALGLVGTTFVASLASAHVRLVAPTPRYPTPTMATSSTDIKDGPCGRLNGTRTTDMNRITVFQPGQTITVQFNETIDHTGWYRIAFDNDGQDAFATPPLSTSAVQMGPTFTLPVLLDNIPDRAGAGVKMYTAQVTLPNVECENCTLQLIQVMDTGTMTNWAADDIYYTCADIVLRRTGGMGGAGGMGGMPNGGAGGGGMPAMGGAGIGGMGGINGGSGGSGIDMGGLGPGGLGGATTGGAAGTATGGTVSTGGVATGGTSTGGAPGGGAPATGGVNTGTGGTSAAGGPAAGTTSNGATPPPPETAEDSGCHLAPGRAAGSSWPLAALALAAVGAIRRRRVSRSAAV